MHNTIRWNNCNVAGQEPGTIASVFLRNTLLVVLCGGFSGAAAQNAILEPARMVVPASMALDATVTRHVELSIDFAAILQITGDVSAIVLGNANIADASVVAAGTIVLTGKAVGATNVMVLGPDGSMIAEISVQVAGQKPGTVTVRRALLPSNYACTASSCQYNDAGPERAVTAE